jgi:beta-lactamase regulating signal transducer with metallopeptidase domain
MTFVVLAAVAAFATFALVNAGASALIAVVFRHADGLLDRYSAASRSGMLFRLRVAPAVLAVVLGFGIALPIFVAFEPFDTDEPVSRTLVTIAGVGLAVCLHGAWRAFSAWRATARVSREWQRRGRRISIEEDDASLPLFAVNATFPTVAVVGIRRPVLFIAERVLAECSADEVHAMIAHESAHVRARDNLKRLVLRACPDLLTPRGRLVRAWTSATEEAADAAAVGSRPGSALDLADALIHVASGAARDARAGQQLLPGRRHRAPRARLVDPAPAPDVPLALGRWLAVSAAVVFVTSAVLLAPVVYQEMETIVHIVP